MRGIPFFFAQRAFPACLVILCAACLCLPNPARSAEPDPSGEQANAADAALSALAGHGRRVKSIESRFKQTRSVSFMDEKLESEGFFVFRAPGYLLWQYTSPLSFNLEYKDGAARFHSDFEGKGAPGGQGPQNRHEAALASALAKHIMVWMSMDMGRIRSMYNVSLASAFPLTLKLTPLKASPGSPMDSMEVTFDDAGRDVARILMRDNDGDFTQLDFFDTKREE